MADKNDRIIAMMQAESTEQTILFLNTNPKAHRMFKYASLLRPTSLPYLAERWADRHNDEFGPLFRAEIPLIKWGKVIASL